MASFGRILSCTLSLSRLLPCFAFHAFFSLVLFSFSVSVQDLAVWLEEGHFLVVETSHRIRAVCMLDSKFAMAMAMDGWDKIRISHVYYFRQ